jgi:transposase
MILCRIAANRMWGREMGHIEGVSRYQRQLLAASLDEMVSAAHVVRVVDAFVERLDLAAFGFERVAAAETGRPGYHPAALLKLYVYGYLNQMRSSRRLAKEAERNIEVQWLTDRQTPCFKTIADFRKDYPEAIVEVCRELAQFCKGQSLFGGEVVAIDGTKVEAVASRKKAITAEHAEKRKTTLDKKIRDFLAGMDEADREESETEPDPEAVKAALAKLRARRIEVEEQRDWLAREGASQRVIGERDARLMKTARQGYQVAYNAQTAVDSKHGLIVAFDLTNDCNDERQLQPMAEAAKQALSVETLTVVADAGYSNGEQGEACAAAGITAVVPRPQVVNPLDESKALFRRDAFTYDRASDTWICPAGETLHCCEISEERQVKRYATAACGGCALRPQCTKGKYRRITRHFHEDAREAMHQRAAADPSWMKLRRELAEHPFGTMKSMMGHARFLVRGLVKAAAEFGLTVLGFNIKRAVSIMSVPALLTALQAHPA